MNELDFDAWYAKNEEELHIKAAESGADRELDFDWEQFVDEQWEEYITKITT